MQKKDAKGHGKVDESLHQTEVIILKESNFTYFSSFAYSMQSEPIQFSPNIFSGIL
jgi:hypothetical protein